MPTEYRLVIIVGQEGVGRTTIVRALLPYLQHGAVIDAEDLGQVNPWTWDDTFKNLLWNNVASLVHNFWQGGYTTVVAGSFINDHADYLQFRSRLDRDVHVSVIHLCASKAARDQRRTARSKPTSKQWRDDLDRRFPEDTTLGTASADYAYIRVGTSALSIAETVAHITRALPELFRPA
jgi:hypothetical protein